MYYGWQKIAHINHCLQLSNPVIIARQLIIATIPGIKMSKENKARKDQLARIKKANKLKRRINRQLRAINSQGFKLIVVGQKARITINNRIVI